jgi:hypothetical protein
MTLFSEGAPHKRVRTKDTQVMFAVRYADGRSAYIRVAPKLVEDGSAPVIDAAKARQATGEIPAGQIVGVQRVK